MKKGELLSSDSIHFSDSLKFTTPGGKVVFGGGGIMPDIFVGLDTLGTSGYLSSISSKGLISEFAYDYLDNNRSSFQKFKLFEDFNRSFIVSDQLMNKFVSYAEKNGVKPDQEGIQTSSEIIRTQIKALIARQIWKNEGFYSVIHTLDNTLKKAVDLVEKKQVAFKGS